MPLRGPSTGAIALAAFAGGTFAGLAGWTAAAVAVGLAGVGLLASRSGWLSGSMYPATLVASLLALGTLHGGAARWDDGNRCAATLLPGAIETEVVLLEPARPGQRAAARVTTVHCLGQIAVQFGRSSGPAAAGDRLRITGQWRPRAGLARPAGGVLVATGLQRLSSDPGPLERLKNWLAISVANLYGPRAGMVEALVLGRRGGLDPQQSRAFGRTGLAHLLSISGFHVGLIWTWLVLLLRIAVGPRRAVVGAAIGVLGYVAFLGFPVPALRAAVLAIATALERHRQRQPAAGALLAVVALIVVAVDPWAVGSLGAWFSVSALWGATAATRWAERVMDPGAIRRVLGASVGASLATAPISAFAFGSVPVVGVFLNLIAIPVTALAVPSVVASLAAATVSTRIAGAFAGGGGGLLAVLELVATHGAKPRWAAVTVEPGWESAAVGGVVIAVVVWVFGRRHRPREAFRRLLWCGAIGAIVHSAGSFHWPGDTGSRLTLHFLDVGQGDAALLETPQGHWWLIDAGPADDRRDAGRDVIVPFLRRHGVTRLEGVVLSHGHRDHYGGMEAVLEAVAVDRVLEPALPVADRGYLALLDQLTDQGIEWIPTRRGASWSVDGVEIDVVHPDPKWPGFGEDLNEDSAVLTIRSGPFLAVFPGDAGLPVEAAVLAAPGGLCPRCSGPVRVDLLKVGHHGSRGASGPAWLDATEPKAAVVSLGFNRYGHPAPETLERLASRRIALWRTDQDETVRVDVDDSTMRVRGRRRRAVFSLF